MDGKDLVQDALFEAYRKLDQYDDSRLLAPWLFRIAHNRCIDFLQRAVRVEAEAASMPPDSARPADPPVLGVGRAVEQPVMSLPPMERLRAAQGCFRLHVRRDRRPRQLCRGWRQGRSRESEAFYRQGPPQL